MELSFYIDLILSWIYFDGCFWSNKNETFANYILLFKRATVICSHRPESY